ncbi:MAG: hypothetical protein N2545_11325 [Thermoflexales bacterium]|nr:hypothetical protein [Thermoflexales bacterium]
MLASIIGAIAPLCKQAMSGWQALSGPPTVLALCVWDGGWLVGSTQGLWRVTGDQAQQVNEALGAVAISAVAAGGRRWLIGAADGIAWSEDGGKTWTAAALETSAQVTQFALSPTFDADGLALAATMNRGVLRTRDGGRTWQACNVGIPDDEVTAIAIAPTVPTMALAATPSGWFFTEDFGRAWVQLGSTREASPIIGIALARNVQVFASEHDGLRYSHAMGRELFTRDAFIGGPISALALSPNGMLLAVATPSVVAVSRDFGEHWTRLRGKAPRGILTLAINDAGEVLCGTQRDGLWRYIAA